MALRETGDGNLVHLLQLLDEGADSGAVPMPASCQFGNGDYKLPVGQAELLLAQILGDVPVGVLEREVRDKAVEARSLP